MTKADSSQGQDGDLSKDVQALASKVLLVDDERDFVETLSERLLLRDMPSSVVFDGEQAMLAIERHPPEVVVLDLRMPGPSGIEVLQHIAATSPQIKVIILTGHGSSADRERCMELGAFAFLHKPVDLEELSQVMRRAMNHEPQ